MRWDLMMEADRRRAEALIARGWRPFPNGLGLDKKVRGGEWEIWIPDHGRGWFAKFIRNGDSLACRGAETFAGAFEALELARHPRRLAVAR